MKDNYIQEETRSKLILGMFATIQFRRIFYLSVSYIETYELRGKKNVCVRETWPHPMATP